MKLVYFTIILFIHSANVFAQSTPFSFWKMASSGASFRISQQAYVKPSNTTFNQLQSFSTNFGNSVSLSGDTLAVGAIQEGSSATGIGGNPADNSTPGSGAVYVFTRSGTVWTQQAYIKASNPDTYDSFGWSVSVSGNTLAVGAMQESSSATGIGGNQTDNSSTSSGAVYLFARTGTVWTQQAYIKASNTDSYNWFGRSVSVNGDTLAVGAYGEGSSATGIGGNQADRSALFSGAVYLFTRSGTVWTQQAYIKASNTEAADYFGYSVSVNMDTLAVGAYGEGSSATGIGGNQADNSAPFSGAVYVFTRTGTAWTQQAYIKASNTASYSQFGFSVSVDADTLAVSANQETSNATGIGGNQADNSDAVAGAVYVFSRSGTNWSQQAYVKASNTDSYSQFGYSVSLSADTLAVGATGECSNATGVGGNQFDYSASYSGAVYVFTRSGTVWTQQAYIKASNTDSSDAFGTSVSVSADTLAVGATGESSNATGIGGNQADNSAFEAGATYLFTRTGTAWSQQAYVKASVVAFVFPYYDHMNFGSSVSVNGDTLAVGAYAESSNATGIGGNQLDNSAQSSGAVYVFTRSGTTWTQQAYIKASNAEAYDAFGTSVSVNGSTLAVGAYDESSSATGVGGNQSDNSAPEAGAVYVYTRTGTAWTQQAYIKASNTDSGDNFGFAVSVSADTLAVGALSEASNSTGIGGDQADNTAPATGAVYVFTRTGTAWSQQAYLKASNSEAGDNFGYSVSLDGDNLAVGATNEASSATGIGGNQADNTAPVAGAVYMFTRTGTVWSQQAYIKASNAEAADDFGVSVSLSANTLAVGAYGEASNATGVGGNQADNSAPNSGAAYVFTRTGTTWTQQAYIKASNTASNSQFGSSVSVDADTLAVGAIQESSNATGIGGNQANNNAAGSGAVYLFTRLGTVWSQKAYVKASNANSGDSFGGSVSVSGHTLAVGAQNEASSTVGVGGNQANNSALNSGAAYVFTF